MSFNFLLLSVLEGMAWVSSVNVIVWSGLLGFLVFVLMFIVWWRKSHNVIASGVDPFVDSYVPAGTFLVLNLFLAVVCSWLVVRYMDELTGVLVGWLR